MKVDTTLVRDGVINEQNIQLNKGGSIKFKLSDKNSGTVITPANSTTMLPQNFFMSAAANPWIEGGYGYAPLCTVSGTGSNDYFEIPALPVGTYDLSLKMSSYGFGYGNMSVGATQGGNNANYAAKKISSIKVTDGAAKDLGTIDIKQGLSITGTIKDKKGNPLPYIPVVALPSLTNQWESELYAVSDNNGKFTIVGLDPDIRYYDIIACPRASMKGGSFFFGEGGLQYGEKTLNMVRTSTVTMPTADFILEKALGSVKGKVVTEDGGLFSSVDDENMPFANVFMQMENTIPRDNPIGDIMVNTAIDGTFTIEALPAGTYRLTVLSGGYASVSKEVVVGDSQADAGTLTMKRGGRIAGNITKNTRSGEAYPSTKEVDMVVAGTDDFGEIIIGNAVKASDTNVSGYRLEGFQPGSTYNILFINDEGEMMTAIAGFSVAYSSYVNNSFNLKYVPAMPSVFSRARKEGNKYTIYFDLTGALRNSVPADDDWTRLLFISTTVARAGRGVLSDVYMSPTRRSMSCTYTMPAGETRFVLQLRAYSTAIDPANGGEYLVNETFEYLAGVGARNKLRISNISGGKVTLEGDSSCIQFSPGSFNVTGTTNSVSVEFQRAEDLATFTQAVSARGAPGRFSIPRAAAAYTPGMYKAMKLAQASASNAFSSFYDILLPQGISHTLKKDATLSIQYSTGTNVDPTTLNIYYYDAENDVYLLENKGKIIDTANNTISAKINHASVFVIMQSQAPSITAGNAYDGPLFVYNYPNPFDLRSKALTKTYDVLDPNATVTGTMIHFGLPPDVSGEVLIRIYNVAGELVRTIEAGDLAAGAHYYTEWDGKNDSGNAVASGVYLGRMTVAGKNAKVFKMAVIK